MPASKRLETWLSLTANLAILVGLGLVLLELKQNTNHVRLQLLDQITSRLYDNNRVLMGENPLEAIERSVIAPERMTYSDFRVVDAYLVNAINEWEDRYRLADEGLVGPDQWRRRVDEDVSWYFGNRFAKKWWQENGPSLIEPGLAEYVSRAVASVSDSATYGFFEATRRVDPTER